MHDRTIGELLELCCACHGPREAIVQDDLRITYDQLIGAVRRNGRALLALGLTRGDRVALLMSDRPEMLCAYYGALWAGLAVVPLNPGLDPELQVHVLADSGARVLCHDADHGGRVREIEGELTTQLLCCDPDGVLDGAYDLGALASEQPAGPAPGRPESGPEDLLGIFYSAGDHGPPRGVAHSQQTFTAALLAEMLAMGIVEREVFAHVAPLTHSSSGLVMPVWLGGGTNVLLGGFDPERVLDTIDREQVTSTMMSAAMLEALLNHPATATADTSSLRTVIYGGAPMSRALIVRALHRFGPVLVQRYGQPEVPDPLTVLTHADHAEATAPGGDVGVLSSCGRPVPTTRVRLVDASGADVPRGELGEIVASGPHLMLRYWNRPQETARTLRDGWLHTGDVARQDERGFLYIVDRAARPIDAPDETVKAQC